MPKLITWKIQSARSTGGGADFGRVAGALDGFSEFDFTADFAFVSTDLAGRVRRLRVGGAETGSDHQPLLLELG